MKNDEPLNLLQSTVPDALEREVRYLCDLKITLDRLSKSGTSQALQDDWMASVRGNTCAYWPSDFMRLVLPFLNWEQDLQQRALRAYVDPRYVVGSNIGGFPEDISDGEVWNRITKYKSDFCTPDDVLYIWYPALGIFFAHEGKHRVALMRRHEQSSIAAWVSEAKYPAAERMMIVAPSDERDEWVVVLDQRYLQVLKRPHVSIRFLSAYGVKTCHWNSVPGLPDELRVRKAVYDRRLHREQNTTAEDERTLDLVKFSESIRQQSAVGAEEIERRVDELAPLQLKTTSFFRSVGCAAIAGGLGLIADIPAIAPGAWLLLGSAVGMLASLVVMRFVGPRNLRHETKG
ncbi:hypothetical protein I6U33_25710 [Pseudomonas carnis]|uniref:hypothetical protein n=1 Tax=Pseudomonas carnis TaxID=2487355 RepID=UPI001C6FAC5C|nr:hypothetical protein [Pseudomonas carnis]MBW9240730.1 hypothetical protein [Pseudomonas carnis]